jgi:hypothetical protein
MPILNSCRKQVISFLASCLGVPEMFDANSVNSVRDLAVCLQEDSSPSMQLLLKSLVEELVTQGYLPMVRLSRRCPTLRLLVYMFGFVRCVSRYR